MSKPTTPSIGTPSSLGIEVLLDLSKQASRTIKYDLPAVSVNFGAHSFERPMKGASCFDTYLSFSEPTDVNAEHQNNTEKRTTNKEEWEKKEEEKEKKQERKRQQGENKGNWKKEGRMNSKERRLVLESDLSPEEKIAKDAIKGIKQKVAFFKDWTPESEQSWSKYSPEPEISHSLEVSARKLQSFCRAANGKKWRHGTRFLLYLNAIKVQRCVRARIPRLQRKRKKATTLIQTMWRGRLGRKRMQHIRDFLHAGAAWEVDGVVTGSSIMLQAAYRMHFARKQYNQQRKLRE